YVLEKVVLPLGDGVTRDSFMRNLRKMRHISKLNEEQLQELQRSKMKALLKHAREKVPYWKNRITNDMLSSGNISELSPLTKDVIRNETDALIDHTAGPFIQHKSSGSTGQQTTVYWSREEQAINRATQIHWWEWAGYRLGDPILQTGITPNRSLIKTVKDRLLNTYYLQAFSHSKQEAMDALNWAGKQKDPVLAGYASSLYVLALFASEAGIQVKFKTAVCWGDKMFDHYRALIEKVFQCKVYETYASAEGLMMGAQADLDYMYQMSSNTRIDLVDDNNQPVKDGQIGHVLVTNLNGYAMPLIKYRIGDLAIKLPQELYPARQMGFPVIQKVIGRDTDLVRTPEGKMMVVHSFTGIFEHIPEIRQFCIIQEKLEGIKVQYIPETTVESSLLQSIRQQILDYLKEPFQVEFEQVDHIPPTKSGKPQIIISKLKPLSLTKDTEKEP
ncbi:MAG: phenylacetate--CoA ligase family protein, partial [Owenweeksia sp.]